MRCVVCAGAMIFPILALFLLPACVHASTWIKESVWLLQPDPNGGYSVLPGRDARGPAGGLSSTSCTTATCTRTGSLPTPHGSPRGTMSPAASFGKGALAAGLLGLGARALPWLTVGAAAYEWYKAANLTVQPDGVITQEQGGYSLTSEVWMTSPTGEDKYGSRQSACTAAANVLNTSDAAYWANYPAY